MLKVKIIINLDMDLLLNMQVILYIGLYIIKMIEMS